MGQIESSTAALAETYSSYFAALPDEREREYEKQIAKLASSCTGAKQQKALEELMDSDSPYAFEAFYCLCTIHRRNRDYELLRRLITTHSRFSDRISFNHIVIQYQVHSESMFDYDELLESAYKDAAALKENAGFLQSFCNAFATICENCNEEDQRSIVDRWYKDALRLINKAIRLDPTYAKFYWTKARIVTLKGEYDEATSLITQAISFEDSSRPDYFLTILNYQHSRTRVEMLKENRRLLDRIGELERRVQLLSHRVDALTGGGKPEETEDALTPPEIYEGDEPYAFVSYAHKDKASVYGIISDLQKLGIRIWYDSGIRAGEEWPEEIGTHLVGACLVLVMLSANAINSKYVRREINTADENNKRILTAVLDDCKLTIGVQLQLGLNQMLLKSRFNHKTFIRKLSTEIQKSMGE